MREKGCGDCVGGFLGALGDFWMGWVVVEAVG